jgi:dTMP kinase
MAYAKPGSFRPAMHNLRMKRGKFIVIDGVDGSGKTTQIGMLKKWLGSKAVFAHDPGGTPAGEAIRGLLLGTQKLPKLSIFFMFLASRAALEHEVIAPALEKGKSVICDRFDSSTYAYQVVAAKQPGLWKLQQAFTKNVLTHTPDVYIILDSDPKEARKRLAKKPDELNSYDRKPAAFHRAVRAGYKKFRPSWARVYYVNADRTAAEVFADVSTIIKRMLG